MLQIKQSQTVICSIVKTKMRATKKIINFAINFMHNMENCNLAWQCKYFCKSLPRHTPNAAISSINYTLEIIEEMGSESKLYSKVVGFRVLHIEINVR